MKPILKQLVGGDFRSIGKSDEVVKQVLKQPALFDDLFSGMLESNPIVRMRAADAIEKITKQRPDLLKKHKKLILGKIALVDQQEVQWHVAQLIPRLHLLPGDMPHVRKILAGYLKTTSSNIVRVMSLQALADLATQGLLDKKIVLREIERFVSESDTPSVRARSRKLLKQLRQSGSLHS